MERLTKRINGKLTVTKRFPSTSDLVDVLTSRLELYEDAAEEQAKNLGQDNQSTLVVVEDGIAPYCPNCGSGEYMTNADEKQNEYCGQCGTKLDWSEVK